MKQKESRKEKKKEKMAPGKPKVLTEYQKMKQTKQDSNLIIK